ncbi:hypothetical protein GUITHDRAFT_101685 [Guillardia theta CCMP2712]|uniref:Uncharacterized protein n=1 Tax=Guillardia theta (strain CCMP2712) TaxID=905079 RepID=L1JVA8_GUITC|nr:hypothetical protein GUITHDRAFT_101685 [Guillardia theta CCMP2712]EKX52516.1 hypothetical protein GUITHDRAFT_101685 [Guillardia theta CCMP2712]|eukprot:XP_005839496.1 hypothetical protein GUITHDRAFT_101685 [Guillardia theta CCMP2712]
MGGVIGKHSLFRSSSKQSVKSNASSQNNLKSDVDGAPDVLGIKNSSIQVQPHEANGQGGSGSAGQHRDLEQQASQCDGSPAEWRSEAGLNEVEDKGQMPSGELRAKYLRAQFEAVSAPLASLDFLQLQKFQARLIRRQGEKLPLSQKNLFSKGKHTEKEIREMAKLTAVQVFKSSGLWNEDADAPRSSASINFEQYLASALHAKMKTESVQSVEFSAGHDAAKHGILKKAATQAVLLPEEIHPKRVRRLSFPDSLSLEEIEEEWEAKKQVSRRLGIEQGNSDPLYPQRVM